MDDSSCDRFTNKTHYDEVNNATAGEVMPRCPYSNRFAMALLFGYMFLGNVVLLNMLIAMMSNTFNNLTSQSSAHRNRWFLSKYRIIDQYLRKPVWVPPFTMRRYFSKCQKF